MLQITVPGLEYFDDQHQVFIYVKGQTLQLEHSLVSISKWESKWHKPFYGKNPMTLEESLDYIRCMTITQHVDPLLYSNIDQDLMNKIDEYIQDPMTATTFSNDRSGRHSREIITSELIYSWMVMWNIPFECQKWHMNRLITLLKICSIQNSDQKKMPTSEIFRRNRALNEARRKALHTRG